MSGHEYITTQDFKLEKSLSILLNPSSSLHNGIRTTIYELITHFLVSMFTH